jgi:hypothetical protein
MLAILAYAEHRVDSLSRIGVVKTRDICRALTTKGFRETKFSHNSSDVNDDLLVQMSKRIRLRRFEFDNIVDCRLTTQQYLTILIEKQQVSLT